MPSIPNARYERKLVVNGLILQEVLALVRRHPAAFRQAYPERTVNNIYLDSPSLSGYRDHVNGAANREKVRVRWYGQADGPVAVPVLEHKLKRGQVSGKFGHRLPPLTLNGEPLQGVLEAAFAGPALPDSVRASVRHLEPALLNRYRRHYFVSADSRFRLTVDFDLQFARAEKSAALPRGWLSAEQLIVIEIKYAPGDADGAAGVTNALPMRVRRCSKYVVGIGATGAAG